MSSKSVLWLGIVIIFLINVLAIHNYINNNYYNTQETEVLEIKPIVLDDKKAKSKDDILKYKTIYIANNKENNKSIKRSKNKPEKKSVKIIKVDTNKTKSKESTKKVVNKPLEKQQDVEEINLDKNAILTATFDIGQKYNNNNFIIKQVARKMSSKDEVKIVIYKYSTKISRYLNSIKKDLVSRGVDIDDIETIYKKNSDKENKIKLILTKKD